MINQEEKTASDIETVLQEIGITTEHIPLEDM
jgi:hypothetical protein